MSRKDGYLECPEAVVTWCVGHLVTMSYPEAYDIKYKRWALETLPFLPETYKYEVIPGVKKQFDIVSSLLNREDIEEIYVCTDSGREGEYIYRLVEQQAGVTEKSPGKKRYRVWIDSQDVYKRQLSGRPVDKKRAGKSERPSVSGRKVGGKRRWRISLLSCWSLYFWDSH